MTTNTNGANVTITETTQIEGQGVQQSTSVELDTLSAQGAVEATAQGAATTPSADEVCFNIAQDGTVIIGKPAAGVSQALEANAAQKYIFNILTDDIKSAVADGDDLVLTFDNGSTVRIEKYMTEIASGEDAVLNFMNGQTVTLASLFPEDVEPAAGEEDPAQAELRDPQPLIEERAENTQSAEQVAKVEPAAGEDVAQALAQIEPAAGDAGAGAAGGNSGFGFNSSFRAQGVVPLSDVGPINPTALEYGLQRPKDDLFFLEEELPSLSPSLETDNVQVLEDGSVGIVIIATPESGNGEMVITITGIPNTWTVTGPGTYDPVTETWTVTTPPGVPFNGGPILTPPADSDVDLPNLVVRVTETDYTTGQTGTSTTIISVIVDAVADTPEVDGLDDSGLEGTTLDIEIPTALTGEEVNAGGIGLDDGSESITSIIIAPVDPSVDLNDFIIVNVNGPVTLDANGHIVFTDRSELQGLTITPKNPNFVGSIDLQITLNTQENPTDGEFDGGNDTNQATDTITLTWIPVANPPDVEVNPRDTDPNGNIDNAWVLEDGTTTLDVVGRLDPAGSGDEILSLTVTGIDLTRLEGGEAGFVASNGPNGEVWIRVPGSPDTAASYTITLSAPNTNYTGTFTFTPLAESDLDLTGMSVTANAYEPASNTNASSAPDDFNVIVDAVADPVDIQAVDDSGREGSTLDIVINNVLTGEEINAGGIGQDDGSESITSIVIAPVDPSVDLNDFTIVNVNGPVTLDANGHIVFTDRAELQGLQITPKNPNFVGSIDLNVTLNTRDNANDTDFNDTNDTAQDSDVLTLTWKPVANPPEVEVDPRNPNGNIDDALVLEDGSAVVDVRGTLDPAGSGDEILSLMVTGIDLTKLDGGEAGFVPSNGPNGEVWIRVPGSPDTAASYTITLSTPGTNYTGTFTFTPAPDSDLDLTGMSVTANAYEPATNTNASSAPDDFNVIVDAVADTPEVDGLDDSGVEGSTLDIEIPTALTGEEVNAGGIGLDDGSESITSIVIAPVDPSVDLNNFTITNVNGPVTLDANGHIVFTDRSELEGLTITPKNPQYSGSIQLEITLNTQENPNDTDFNGGNDTNSATDTITLTWTPTINPPFVKVNNGQDDAFVKEDHSIDVPVVANLATGANAAEYLTLTVTGINLTRLEGGADGFEATGQNGAQWVRVAGSPDTAASYTITLPAGVNYTGTFTFTPAAQSDLDLTGMRVTATATDPSVAPAISASSGDNFNVIVDAVADTPSVRADDNAGEEGDALAVNIDGLLGVDNDGSESITGYEVRGNQAEMINFTFTVNGTVRTPVNGVISLTPAEVDSLVVTPKDSTFVGSLNLTGVVLTADTPSDREFDTSDNTNSARDPFTLTWNDDDQPIITQPEKVTVDETNLAGTPRTTSVSDKIDVDFGDDGVGATIKGNNTFDLGGATSNGNPITVSYSEATGTYTGSAGGKTVFTLVIENDGDYTFTLRDTIDHPVDGDNRNGEHNDPLDFTFGFTATDSDGDTANGNITVRVLDDGPQANHDVNSFDVTSASKDYNVVFLLDVSGSMAGDKLALLKASVSNLLGDFNAYQGGQVKVHIVPFGSEAGAGSTFLVSDDTGLTNALNYLNSFSAGGQTNYEAPLQSAISWLQGNTANDPIPGADTFTYFVSDGAPNRHVDPSGTSVNSNAPVAMNEILGKTATDKVSEVEALKALNKEVISIGIGVNATTLGRLDLIDSNGDALDVKDPSDLDAAFQSTNPVMGSASGNVITGVGNTNAGGADHLSEDAPNTITLVNGVTIAETGVTTVNGTFGTLEISANGSYTYKLNPNLYKGGDIVERFTYTLKDGDGDTATATLTINGNGNDVPKDITTTTLLVDEAEINGQAPIGSDSASGTVTANFGYDAPGTFHTGSPSKVTFSGAKDNALKSNGVPVTITVSGDKYIGKAGNKTVFELQIKTDGEYTFTLLDQLDHGNPNSPSDIISLNFEVIARDADGDSSSGRIRVDVRDDGPVAHNDYVAFNEAAESAVGNVITGAGNTNTGGADNLSEDGPNTITAVNGTTVSSTGATRVTGAYGVLEISANGSYTYTLNRDVPNGTVAHETFTYTLKDADGDASQAKLEFDVTAKPNDVPTNVVTEKLIVDETNVMGKAPFGTDSATGEVTANFGNDGPGSFKVGSPANFTFAGGKNGALTSNGVAVDITVEGNKYVGKAGSTKVFELEIKANGEYTFTLHDQLDHNNPNNTNEGMDLYFEVKAVDADGDAASGQIRVYVQDDAPIAKKDVNDFTFNVVEKDYNVVLVLDVSGSMSGNKLTLLKSSIANLLNEYNDYQNGDIKVHIVPFATSAQKSATFTVTDDAGLNNAINFVNGLNANGFTNYEQPLQSAISWLQGKTANDPIPGAETYTYFVSDGEPNRHVDPSGAVVAGTASDTMKEITGTSATDKVSEVAILKSLSTEVFGVGIGVNATTLGRLGTIDSDGKALDVKKAEDLSAILLENNPIIGGQTSGNVITGAGNDNTGGADTLSFDGSNFISLVNGVAIAQTGTTTVNGSHGKLVIAADGSYTYTLNPNATTDVQERFNYTLTDADGDRSTAALHINATVATPGASAKMFAASYDVHDLYGTEGADVLVAQSDNTTMTGGKGADTFVFGADSHDNVITDYNAAEGDALDISAILTGYDELTDMLEDFVFVNKSGSDTQVFVDASGSGDISAATLLVTLDGVDVVLNDLNINTNNGSVV